MTLGGTCSTTGLLKARLSKGITSEAPELELGFIDDELSPTFFFLEGLSKVLDRVGLLEGAPIPRKAS